MDADSSLEIKTDFKTLWSIRTRRREYSQQALKMLQTMKKFVERIGLLVATTLKQLSACPAYEIFGRFFSVASSFLAAGEKLKKDCIGWISGSKIAYFCASEKQVETCDTWRYSQPANIVSSHNSRAEDVIAIGRRDKQSRSCNVEYLQDPYFKKSIMAH